MPEARAAARAAPAREENGGRSSMMRSLFQSLGIFILIQVGMRWFIGNATKLDVDPASPNVKLPIPAFTDRPGTFREGYDYHQVPNEIAPIWPAGIPLDLRIYMSSSLIVPPLHQMPKDTLVVEQKAFGYGDYKDVREVDATFPLPKEVQSNGTLWAHIFVAQSGEEMDPSSKRYDTAKAYHFARPFTQFLPKRKVRKAHSLLAGKNASGVDTVEDVSKGQALTSYYHPNFTLSFVPDTGIQQYPSMHPAIRSFVQLESTGARDASGAGGWYYPVLYVNTFWQLRNHMMELNNTIETLPIHITLNNFASWKFSILASIDEGMKINAAKAARGETVGPGSDGAEFEQFKNILLDSNIYLLGTTFFVSILHMIFEGMAFKNDVAHWRKKKDNIGTSLRTILANVVMQAVIFLYLLDNNENTSWMILFSQGMGIAIEAWKVTKTVNVRVRATPAGSLLPYTIAFEDKHKLSEVEKKTQEYDQIAFKYLYIVAVPLLLAYAAYSLVYDEHKSWYSFVIATLVGSVYAYGFLMMVPSLYINYRLKSVAHMPGKTMMYKFLNTFIDDLFAFTIKMPMLHRLATLRDDVIFFVYLYQSYKYKIDYSRVNEFGQGGVSDDEAEEDEGAAATKPLKAAPESGKAGENKAAMLEDIKGAEEDVAAKASGVASGSGKGRKRK